MEFLEVFSEEGTKIPPRSPFTKGGRSVAIFALTMAFSLSEVKPPFRKGGLGGFHSSRVVITPGSSPNSLAFSRRRIILPEEAYPMMSSTANSSCGNATGEMR